MLRILSEDIYTGLGASLMAQRVKNLPAMQDIQGTWVQSLGWEDALEEKNGNLLQDFCLKHLMDRAAWQATVQRVTKFQTRLSTSITGFKILWKLIADCFNSINLFLN